MNHNILLQKLEHYGIRCVVLKWFQSYLENRKLFVGRSMWPIFVQFCWPHSGTTFSLHESIDFYVLNTNSLVVTSRNPQFFLQFAIKILIFLLELCSEISCYLQFLY